MEKNTVTTEQEDKKFSVSYMYATITKRIDDPESSIKAYVSLTYCNAATIHGIAIREGDNGLFVTLPTYQVWDSDTQSPKIDENGKNIYKEYVHPITSDARKKLNECVISAFENENGYAYIRANADTPRNTTIEAKMNKCSGDKVKAAGTVTIGDIACHNVLVSILEKKDTGEEFVKVNYPNYSFEDKDNNKQYIDFLEIKKNGNCYDFRSKQEKEMNFKQLADNIIVKSAREVSQEIDDLINEKKVSKNIENSCQKTK